MMFFRKHYSEYYLNEFKKLNIYPIPRELQCALIPF